MYLKIIKNNITTLICLARSSKLNHFLVHGTEHISNGGPHYLVMEGLVYSKEQINTTLDKNAVELKKILNKTNTVLEK